MPVNLDRDTLSYKFSSKARMGECWLKCVRFALRQTVLRSEQPGLCAIPELVLCACVRWLALPFKCGDCFGLLALARYALAMRG